MSNYILVIKGVSKLEYQTIKEDLAKQYQAKGMEVPLFAHLPQDYAEIDILWIDEDIERENYKLSLESIGLMRVVND